MYILTKTYKYISINLQVFDSDTEIPNFDRLAIFVTKKQQNPVIADETLTNMKGLGTKKLHLLGIKERK